MALTVCDFDLFLVAENDIFVVVIEEMNWVDWLIVRWPQTHEFTIESYIKDWQSASFTHSHQQASLIALNMTDCGGWVDFAYSGTLSEIPHFKLITTTEHDVKFGVEVQSVDETVSMEGSHELALFEGNTVDLIGGGTDTKVGIDRVEDEVSGVMWDSGFVVGTILSVDFDGSVDLSHGNFAVVVGEDTELDNFAVESSETFETEFGGVEYFYLWTVDASGDDVALIVGDFDLVGGDFELEILDEFDSASEFLIVAEGLVVFFGVLDEVLVGLASRHVVCLDPVYLSYFVHQQFSLL